MDGKYLISVGGYDQTIIQWKREGEDTDEESAAYLSSSSEDIEEEEKKAIERKSNHYISLFREPLIWFRIQI